MFAAINAYVTTGVRLVGMLSRSGIIGPDYGTGCPGGPANRSAGRGERADARAAPA